ncbi:ABC transporter permease [Streptomyces sp. NPDC049577]|uniref:ABC transporter permease n=1 Tax=Streptomyces sp. NPDC049577 TaxID=3155153 RepID=UPI003423D513
MTTPQQPAAPSTAPAPQPPFPPLPPQAAPQPVPWPGQAPLGGGYVSPIPVRKAHLGDAIASEWTKIRSLRSTMWTLGTMAGLTVGIGLLVASLVDAEGSPSDQASMLGFAGFGLMLGLLCVLTLGVLTMSSEYGTGMIRTTLTACPSRGRVLGAKAIVFAALTFATTLVTTIVVELLGLALMDSSIDTTCENGL